MNLPHGNGKKIKVGVLCEEAKIKEAKSSGADVEPLSIFKLFSQEVFGGIGLGLILGGIAFFNQLIFD